jgi:protein-tyrosine phosphatase
MIPFDALSAIQYGRRLGLFQHLYHVLKYRMRYYALWGSEAVDWARVERLVFVCEGNILRSPFAEVCAAGWGVPTTSFGLGTHGGDVTPLRAVQVALENGVDLSGHRSRVSASVDLNSRDLVLVMEPGQAKRVARLGPQRMQIGLLGLFGCPVRPYLQDPYGLREEYLRVCYGYLTETVASLVQTWRTRRQDSDRCTAKGGRRG